MYNLPAYPLEAYDEHRRINQWKLATACTTLTQSIQ